MRIGPMIALLTLAGAAVLAQQFISYDQAESPVTENSQTVRNGAAPDQPNESGNEDRNKESGWKEDLLKNPSNWLVAILTAALVGCNVFLAGYTGQLSKATRGLKASTDRLWRSAERTTMIGTRAWLYIGVQSKSIEIVNSGDHEAIKFKVHFPNYGNSPARVDSFCIDCISEMPGDIPAVYGTAPIVASFPVGMKESYPHHGTFYTSREKPYVVGWVKYADAFPGTPQRESRFCLKLVQGENGKWEKETCGGPHWNRFT